MQELDRHLQRFLHPIFSVITGFNRESGFTFYQGVYLFVHVPELCRADNLCDIAESETWMTLWAMGTSCPHSILPQL